MAAPNLKAPTTIHGKTTFVSLASTNETSVLANAASSGKALRVTALFVSNIDGTNAAAITLKYYNAATGGTGYALASTLTVPADATVVILTREQSVWLEENTSLRATASAGGDLNVVCSYEDVS
tara:strand:- start:99 stop:470 length:372 start_codon:yes stop_codon:yes gene_type:complete